jgi:PAS domain-containing protein
VSDEDALRARVATLEDERRRAFDEAQREADAMFAQYQLSQLLASGDNLEKLAPAVLAEIARTSGAGAAALWLADRTRRTFHLIASVEPGDEPTASGSDGGTELPIAFADSGTAGRWAARAGWFGVPLEESRALGVGGAGRVALGYLAIRPARGGTLDPGHARYLGLVRRELALAFRAAQLRGALLHERATLAAILDGASDAIIAVDSDRRITRLNGGAARRRDGAPGNRGDLRSLPGVPAGGWRQSRLRTHLPLPGGAGPRAAADPRADRRRRGQCGDPGRGELRADDGLATGRGRGPAGPARDALARCAQVKLRRHDLA